MKENLSPGESEEIEVGEEEEFQAGSVVSWNMKTTSVRTKQNIGKYRSPPKNKFSFTQKQPLLQLPSQTRAVLLSKLQEANWGDLTKISSTSVGEYVGKYGPSRVNGL